MKHKKLVVGITITILASGIIGGIIMTQMKTLFDIFLIKDFTKPTKDEQINYLKKYEQKMTDYVKSEKPKVENVQWDWDSVEIETIQPDAGGIPTGDKYQSLDIEGGFNNITDSNFVLSFGFDNKTLYPNMKHKSITQPLRIGGNLYE